MRYLAELLPNQRYHIINHAVGNENLFRKEENYRYFLQKFYEYIHPVAQTYAYCLMPNHFHFLLNFREEEILQAYYQKLYPQKNGNIENYHVFLMQRFSNFCNAYAKAYNKMYDRKGALFIDFLRRIRVESDEYFTNLLGYIHCNPKNHGFCKKPEDWFYSSYHAYKSEKTTNLPRQEVAEWFGTITLYEEYHQQFNQIIDDNE
ncbi:MAG: hypothetical protein NW226_13005 [Microscillaceae bacterium]|nr:hypothetical protein [Microscillaceae bacterium]